MDKTVPRSVSVTTMAFVCRRPEGASAAPGTQENGNIWQHCVITDTYFFHVKPLGQISHFRDHGNRNKRNFKTTFNKVLSTTDGVVTETLQIAD